MASRIQKGESSKARGFVVAEQSMEGRGLSYREAVNRFLMGVEAGRVQPDQADGVIADIASTYGMSRDSVLATVEEQGRRRIESNRVRSDRIESALGGKRRAH